MEAYNVPPKRERLNSKRHDSCLQRRKLVWHAKLGLIGKHPLSQPSPLYVLCDGCCSNKRFVRQSYTSPYSTFSLSLSLSLPLQLERERYMRCIFAPEAREAYSDFHVSLETPDSVRNESQGQPEPFVLVKGHRQETSHVPIKFIKSFMRTILLSVQNDKCTKPPLSYFSKAFQL